MNKKDLEQFISKYHLNGLVESVTWNSTENKELTVKFVTPSQDCAGFVNTKDLGLGNSNISIYSTSQFNKLLYIIDDFMTIDVVKGNQNIPYQLNIKDKNFDLDYYLSSEDLIPETATVNEPENYDVEFDIDEDFIKNFTKAYSALEKPDRFTLGCNVENSEKFIEITVGNRDTFANKIKLRQPADFLIGTDLMAFSAVNFREILNVNKNVSGKIKVSEIGLLKLEFTEDDTTSTYFIVKLSS